MKDIRITSIRFEMDCSNLVDMTTTLMDWLAFASEIDVFQILKEDFEDVNIINILPSINIQADSLMKEAKTRSYTFFRVN